MSPAQLFGRVVLAEFETAEKIRDFLIRYVNLAALAPPPREDALVTVPARYVGWLIQEHDNLRAGVERAAESTTDPVCAAHLRELLADLNKLLAEVKP